MNRREGLYAVHKKTSRFNYFFRNAHTTESTISYPFWLEQNWVALYYLLNIDQEKMRKY